MASGLVVFTDDQLRQLSDILDEALDVGYLTEGEGIQERLIPIWDVRTPEPDRRDSPGMEEHLWADVLREARVKRFLTLKNVSRSRKGRNGSPPTPKRHHRGTERERGKERGGERRRR